MNDFEQGLLRYYSSEQLSKVQSKKIGIAGCGGLGSNIAAALVRSGCKYFEIVDKDLIESSNLNRQNFFLSEIGFPKVAVTEKRIKQINPDAQVHSRQVILTNENIFNYFDDADIVFEAFDNVESKRIIIEQFGNSSKLVILGSGMAGISNEKPIAIRKIKDNVYIVGDGITEADSKNPPFAPRVIACASLMASVALEKSLLS